MNRDAKRTADFPIGQYHVFTVTVRELKRQRQAAEKVRQHRSRIVQILNVPQRVRLRSSLAAALLDELFELPAGIASLPKANRLRDADIPQSFLRGLGIGYTVRHAIGIRATDTMDTMPGPHDAVGPSGTFLVSGPGHHIGAAFLSRCGAHI